MDGHFCRSARFGVRSASEELMGDIGDTGPLPETPDPMAVSSMVWNLSTSCTWAQFRCAGRGARTFAAAFPTKAVFLSVPFPFVVSVSRGCAGIDRMCCG